jgi:hypothetical protein
MQPIQTDRLNNNVQSPFKNVNLYTKTGGKYMINKIYDWLQHTAFWNFLLSRIFPFFHFRLWGYPKFPINEYFKIREMIRNDTSACFYAFVGTDRTFLSWKLRKLIEKSTKWSHAGILLLNDQNELDNLDVTHIGKNCETALVYMREVDDFAIIKFPITDLPKFKNRVKNYKEADVKVTYDNQLDLSKELTAKIDNDEPFTASIYCSEEVYILGNGLTVNELKTRMQYGKEYFEPDDVFKAGEVVYSYFS